MAGERTRRAPPDGGLRALLRARLPALGQWTSVETGGTTGGVPDLCLLADGVTTWIECKRTTGHAVRLRPAQVGWLYTCWRRGGRALVVTRRQSRGGADELYVTSARWARELRTDGLRGVVHVLREEGGPSRWNWKRIEAALRGDVS